VLLGWIVAALLLSEAVCFDRWNGVDPNSSQSPQRVQGCPRRACTLKLLTTRSLPASMLRLLALKVYTTWISKRAYAGS
jgi:hypothetical protein